MERYQLSPSFYLDEFNCHSGAPFPISRIGNLEELARHVLQPLRDAWAAPLIVQSGYRTSYWNKAVGGAKRSAHRYGEDDGSDEAAADIRPVSLADVAKLHALALELHAAGKLPRIGGLGNYPGRWIHVDTRLAPDRHLRRWVGQGIGSEPEPG